MCGLFPFQNNQLLWGPGKGWIGGGEAAEEAEAVVQGIKQWLRKSWGWVVTDCEG